MGPKDMISNSPKRSLGQNFFVNKNLAKNIVSIVSDNNPQLFLEIGPGTGVFTNLLSQKAPVVAIEKDEALYQMLRSVFEQSSVKLIHSDIREMSRKDLLDLLPYKKVTIYGSLPYNQSKKIIAQMLSYSISQDHYYIIQKEVAQKYADKVKLNRLNSFSQIFGSSKILKIIKPENFSPKPKVESSLIHFSTHEPKIPIEDIENYSSFINLLFSNPRKKIRGKLRLNTEGSNLIDSLLSKRSENLEINEVIQLYRAWNKSTQV